MHKKPEDFQKFYYTKVGLGEGCGCAERVIDVYEADRKAALPHRFSDPVPFGQRLWNWAAALGLTRRPKKS